jgi:hypothetical protein
VTFTYCLYESKTIIINQIVINYALVKQKKLVMVDGTVPLTY